MQMVVYLGLPSNFIPLSNVPNTLLGRGLVEVLSALYDFYGSTYLF